MQESMRVLVITVIALLCNSIEAFPSLATHIDCSAVFGDEQPQQNSGMGTIRLTILHHQHPCSPVRHPTVSWPRSRMSERQLAARLFFRRRRRHAPPTNVSAPVTSAGALYGFVAQVAVGTPPTRQNMLIDSAASFSWIQCQPCIRTASAPSCFDQDGPVFDPRASTTYRRLPCSSPSCISISGNDSAPGLCAVQENTCIYYMPYMDKSVSAGRWGTDTLSFGENAFPGFVFGCSSYYSGFFGRYSGILGFASGKTSFFSQAVERTRSYKAFSFYLPSPTSVGYIQVGAYDEGGMVFTPMFTNGSDYYIALTGILVDGCPIGLSGSSGLSPQTVVMDCYVDLGTPWSVLPRQAYEKLSDAVADRIKGFDRIRSSPGCFEPAYLSAERVIPEVQLEFSNGPRLVLDEQKLMFKYGDGVLCLGFMQGAYYLLGSKQMQMIYAAQDVEKSRMGFLINS